MSHKLEQLKPLFFIQVPSVPAVVSPPQPLLPLDCCPVPDVKEEPRHPVEAVGRVGEDPKYGQVKDHDQDQQGQDKGDAQGPLAV